MFVYGPAFGYGWDLIIRHDNIRRYGSNSYPNIDSIISYNVNYILEDYEVFQVIKK